MLEGVCEFLEVQRSKEFSWTPNSVSSLFEAPRLPRELSLPAA